MDDYVLAAVLLVVVLLVVTAIAAGVGRSGTDRATVTVLDSGGDPRVTIDARVADTPGARYRGLGGVDELGRNEGMLFVYRRAGNRTFVMRGVDYPIDIIFVNDEGRITTIHHAHPESRPYTRYRGYARWVIEVDGGTANRTGMQVGDRVLVDRSGE